MIPLITVYDSVCLTLASFTQVGRYGQELFDFSAERVASSVQESLARLQIGYIDIIQCHDIEYGNLDQVKKMPKVPC